MCVMFKEFLLQSGALYATIALITDGGASLVFQTKRMAGYLFALLAVVQAASFFIYYQATENIDAKWAVFPAYWLRSIADAAAFSGAVHAAGGTGNVVFGGVGQYSQLFHGIHPDHILI